MKRVVTGLQLFRICERRVRPELPMSLKDRYTKEVVQQLQRELGEGNAFAVPRIMKVVVNTGTGGSQRDPKLPDVVAASLMHITGQQSVRTLARKSIATFKIREGQPIGMMATLRGPRMWAFLEKLVMVTLPRVRDFRGLAPSVVDAQGNCSIGFREHIVFPEIEPDAVDQLHGLQVTIVTNARTQERGLALLRALGFPFR